MSKEYLFTDEEKLKSLAEGLPIKFSPLVRDQAESVEDKSARTIKASWLITLAQGQEHAITVPIYIENAIIEDDLHLRYIIFQQQISIINSIFLGKVDFSFSSFKKLVRFNGSKFEKSANFRAIDAQYDVEIISAYFSDNVSFVDSNIEQVLNADGAQFNNANFNRIKVLKAASFRALQQNEKLLPVRFHGDARFISANFMGEARFEGAEFLKDTYFQLAVFGTVAQFGSMKAGEQFQRTRFIGKCMFNGVHILGNADFAGAQFKSRAEFESIQVERHAFFMPLINVNDLIPVCFESDVSFYDARIKSNAQFYSAQFEGAANFERIKIGGQALFSPFEDWKEVMPVIFKKDVNLMYATIGGNLVCTGVQFEAASKFGFSNIAGNAVFSAYIAVSKYKGTRFDGNVDFFSSIVGGYAVFNSTTFRSSVNFQNIRIEGRLVVEQYPSSNQPMPTRFEGKTSFEGAHIKLGAVFTGTQFEQDVDFRNIQIDSNLLFVPARQDTNIRFVKFNQQAIFSGALIKGYIEFKGAEFGGKAFFNRIQVEGDVTYGHFINNDDLFAPKFEDDVFFAGSKIKGDIAFVATKFSKSVDFRFSSIGGNLSFVPVSNKDELQRSEFGDNTIFSGARIYGLLTFMCSIFTGKTYFDRMLIEGDVNFGHIEFNEEYYDVEFHNSVSFYASHFKSLVDFRHAIFKRTVNFNRVKAESTVQFNGALFEEDLLLRDAYINVAIFNTNEEKEDATYQFSGNVDIVGFSYDRLEVDRDELLMHTSPFDRQPYTYLEKTLRSAGYDIQADKIYLKRRAREEELAWAKVLGQDEQQGFTKREKLFGLFHVLFRKKAVSQRKEIPSALFNSLEKWFFNYGVRPYRLILISAFVVVLGFVVFNQPNSVIRKEPSLRTSDTIQLSRGEAFNVSLNQFIPIIEIPPGSEWKPSTNPVPILGVLNLSFAGYATLHRIAGLVLIPLGLAALTGRLYRKEK